MTSIYLDDLTPGRVFDLGSVTVSEDEIVEFATRFDPQPFHVDPVAAAASPFGGIIASGWHTGSLLMRQLVDHFLGDASSMGSPGLDELRWPAPVRGGDRLTARATVLEAVPSRTSPETRGTAKVLGEMVNQHGVTVLSLTATILFGRRPT